MKNNFKKLLKRTSIGLLAIGLFFIILTILDIIFSDPVGDCLDVGSIWDPVRQVCRKDCLTWSEKYGCVPLDADDALLEKVWPTRREAD